MCFSFSTLYGKRKYLGHNWGQCCLPGDIWQCLETVLVVMTREGMRRTAPHYKELASRGERLGMLLNTLQCPGQPPTPENDQLLCATVEKSWFGVTTEENFQKDIRTRRHMNRRDGISTPQKHTRKKNLQWKEWTQRPLQFFSRSVSWTGGLLTSFCNY